MLALLLALAPGAVRPPVSADPPDVNDAIADQERIEEELARQRSQLADLRREQASLSASLSNLETDLNSVGLELEAAIRKLNRVSRALDQSRADLQRYTRQIATLEEDLEAVADDIVESKEELVAREALLQDHLRAAYEQSQTSLLEILISTDSFTEATSQLSYMLTLSDEDRRLAEEIREARHQLEIRQRTLQDGRETLSALRDAEAERAAALDAQQQEVDAARAKLAAYRRKLKELQAEQMAELRAAARNEATTQELIAAHQHELKGQRKLVQRLKRRANRLDVAYRGRFTWPERGDFVITQEFGHTTFNPRHTGIDLAYHSPRCGGPIYAAGDGVVLADGRPSAKYGDTAIGVVIGHSQRLHTWYWHLSHETVEAGQEVEVGDLIGYEGATGEATGCHLHFEVRLDGEPMSPRDYLP